MADDAACSPRGRADGEDALPPEEEPMAHDTGDVQGDELCGLELLEGRVSVRSAEEEEQRAPSVVAEAEALAAGWMLDFFCLALCRAFRDERLDDFHRTRDCAEAVIHGLSSLTASQLKTVYICQFLTRIAAGKALDAQFEVDERITPLESALTIWASIEKEHDKLHGEIENLIKVQAIAVCMEDGNFKEAEEVFERIFGDPDSFTPLKSKLLKIISQKETFHSMFQYFSYNHMMDKVKSYVNCVLSEKSSSFLMKAAIKVVESKKIQTTDSPSESNGKDVQMDTEANLNTIKSVNGNHCIATESPEDTVHLLRSHKDLLVKLKHNNQQENFIKEGTLPRERQIKRIRKTTETRKLVIKRKPEVTGQNRRKKQAWNWDEDYSLKCGVKMFGEGNWSKILSKFKFNNRTSVMLKDRWRTMKKLELIDNEG